MKTKLPVLALLAGSSLLAQPRFYVGARIAYPVPVAMYAAPPAPLVAYVAPRPGPGYTWVGGLLVSRRSALPLACRLLDSPRIRRRPLGRAPLCRGSFLRRLLAPVVQRFELAGAISARSGHRPPVTPGRDAVHTLQLPSSHRRTNRPGTHRSRLAHPL